MLYATKITIFHILWFTGVVAGEVFGGSVGARVSGVAGIILSAVIGVAAGHLVGALPEWLSFKLFFRKLERSSDDELWRMVNLECWNFSQTMALLQLAGRNQDVRGLLPRIIGMLEAEDELTRV